MIEPVLTTYTGLRVNPLDMKPEQIDARDIAHHLACINRFNGAAAIPINVAQHSVWVSKIAGPPNELEGLLHDAAEAYLGDITKWLKATPEFEAYRAAEERLTKIIYEVFKIRPDYSNTVKWADILAVRWEHEQAYGFPSHVPGYGVLSKGERRHFNGWEHWDWKRSEFEFLLRFRDLHR